MKAINVKFKDQNEDLHTKLKMQALIEKMTMNDLVVKIIEKYLNNYEQNQAKK